MTRDHEVGGPSRVGSAEDEVRVVDFDPWAWMLWVACFGVGVFLGLFSHAHVPPSAYGLVLYSVGLLAAAIGLYGMIGMLGAVKAEMKAGLKEGRA